MATGNCLGVDDPKIKKEGSSYLLVVPLSIRGSTGRASAVPLVVLSQNNRTGYILIINCLSRRYLKQTSLSLLKTMKVSVKKISSHAQKLDPGTSLKGVWSVKKYLSSVVLNRVNEHFQFRIILM